MIYYASHTLNDAQINYTMTKKEVVLVVSVFQKFRPYLIGSNAIVFIDHAALKQLLPKGDAKLKLVRQMLFLQEFDCGIRDRKGSENSIADHLSRIVYTMDTKALFLSISLMSSYLWFNLILAMMIL